MISFLPVELHPNWAIVLQVLYTLFIAAICIRVIIDTRSVSKTLAYLLLVIFIPILGSIFYLSFGVNYRKRKIYNKKLKVNNDLKAQFLRHVIQLKAELEAQPQEVLQEFEQTYKLLSNPVLGGDLCLPNWRLNILQNGERKFPFLINALKNAKHHIHLEYYIIEDDTIGKIIQELLIQKVQEGVAVRLIYDDFGSSDIRRGYVSKLRQNGVQAFPFNKIRLLYLANRLNYRNHRKIVVIDGLHAFVGGINIADKYINDGSSPLFWRDTHLEIHGYSTFALQQIFLTDWNFCSREDLAMEPEFFPFSEDAVPLDNFVQVVSSGPDNDMPNILYSILNAINAAKEEILITTPYYIPDNLLQEAIIMAALSGKSVKLLVPLRGDSKLVTIASNSFYEELLQVGVQIYEYEKGFIHAKTFVVDRTLASVGTANLDTRSFDLNFEVNAMIYDKNIASQMADDFYNDLKDAKLLELKRWKVRPRFQRVIEKIIRLISPFM